MKAAGCSKTWLTTSPRRKIVMAFFRDDCAAKKQESGRTSPTWPWKSQTGHNTVLQCTNLIGLFTNITTLDESIIATVALDYFMPRTIEGFLIDYLYFACTLRDLYENDPPPEGPDAPVLPHPSEAVDIPSIDGEKFSCEPDEFAEMVAEMKRAGFVKQHRTGLFCGKGIKVPRQPHQRIHGAVADAV